MKSNNPRKSRKSSKAVETISTDFAGRSTVLVVLLSTCAAFLPVLWNGFVDWDDDKTLTQNPHYRGLGWTQLRWMFTTFHAGHYQPLGWVTFGLDYVVWGTEPELAEAHESLGRALVVAGKSSKAVKHFEEAVRIVRGRPAVRPMP
jgi:hypothetical protein